MSGIPGTWGGNKRQIEYNEPNIFSGRAAVINRFYEFSRSRSFWLLGAGYLLLMESIALYYQYGLDLYPCALCVQIRAWVLGALVVALLTSFASKEFWWRWAGLTLTLFFLAGGLYTSWYSWGVEKGRILSSCTMGAGFPESMPLDQWVPWLFSAQGICGRSPNMWFGLTMNETLLITLSLPVLVLLAQWLLHAREAVAGRHKVIGARGAR